MKRTNIILVSFFGLLLISADNNLFSQQTRKLYSSLSKSEKGLVLRQIADCEQRLV